MASQPGRQAQQLFALGMQLAEQQKFGKAIDILLQVVKLEPKWVPARVNLANLFCDRGASGDMANALAQYKVARSLAPRNFEVCANYALFLSDVLEQEEKTQKSSDAEIADLRMRCAEAYAGALACNPQWFDGRFNLANVLSAMGSQRESDAITQYEVCRKLKPGSGEVCHNFSLVLQRSGNLQRAHEEARKSVESDSSKSTYWENLGNILYSLGSMEESLTVTKRALELQPSSLSANLTLANIYQQSDKPKLALPVLRDIVARLDTPGTSLTPSTSKMLLPCKLQLFSLLNSLGFQSDATGLFSSPSDSCFTSSHENLDEAMRWILAGQFKKAEMSLSTAIEIERRSTHKTAQHITANQRKRNKKKNNKKKSTHAKVAPTAVTCPDVEDDSSIDLVTREVSQLCLEALLHVKLPGAIELAHKGRLAANLQAKGDEFACIAPPSLRVRKDNMTDLPSGCRWDEGVWGGGQVNRLWYLKDPHQQRGQGVHIVSCLEAMKEMMEDNKEYILQPSLSSPCLLDERKFGLRVHAMIVYWPMGHTASVYCFRESILTKTAKKFDPSDYSLLNQITCTSVQRSEPGYQREKVKGPASLLWDGYEKCYPLIQHAVLKCMQATHHKLLVSPAMEEGTAANHATGVSDASSSSELGVFFQVLGFDVIVDAEGNPFILEANMAPQLGDAQGMADLREHVALPLINALPQVLLAGFKWHATCQGKTTSPEDSMARELQSSALSVGSWDWIDDL